LGAPAERNGSLQIRGFMWDINAGFMCATELTDEAGALIKEGPASIIIHSQREERAQRLQSCWMQ